ncbi:hypothetical protein B0H63DRAFT_269231 [Podospora didyma]|uniref:LysM domain-containing protein n=1 Tax=Podospora didyma TaxID=330526 RepID=A0AAE0NA83_9PEZI|nr:hypothetical protein B0H63DRAFT_269231 [Podospora didyma]
MEACCTCATLLSAVPRVSPLSEKPLPYNRRLEECCGRVICGSCINKNPRFSGYCPYCQTPSTSTPSSPVPRGARGGLKDLLPSYISSTTTTATTDLPLAYTTTTTTTPPSNNSNIEPPPSYSHPPLLTTTLSNSSDPEKSALALLLSSSSSSSRPGLPHTPAQPLPPRQEQEEQDTLHFLDHDHDTISSLSLRYNVPASALRRANKLGSDHLLLGRRSVLIPGRFYKGGLSLSPRPVEGEEEEVRKGKIRRWMVACKCSDYDIAVLYLEQAGYDFDDASEAYFGDEAWESEHPLTSSFSHNGGRSSKDVMRWRRKRRDNTFGQS